MRQRRFQKILAQPRPFMGRVISMPIPDKDAPITKQQARNLLVDLLGNVTREQEQCARISVEDVRVSGLNSLDVEVYRSPSDRVGKTQKLRITVEVV